MGENVLWEHKTEITEEKYKELSLQVRNYWFNVDEALPPDGYWALWKSKTGKYQEARFKEDAMNHFFPNAEFELEDCVAWMPLP